MTTTTQPGLFHDTSLDKLVWNKSELILSATHDQDKIIRDILRLYNRGLPFDADATYSKGVFYRNLPQPLHKFDLNPQHPDVVEADARHLPVDDGSFVSVMFDPPFKASNSKVKGIIEDRFTAFASINDLWEFYDAAIVEFWRVLKPGGLLVVKCQDTVSSGHNHASAYRIQRTAFDTGFAFLDTFILLARSVLLSPNMTNQQHARKNHSYFFLFSEAQEESSMRMLQKYQDYLLRNISEKQKAGFMAVDITPSARWFLADADQEYWDFRNDFPCVTPPAPLTWMEFNPPDVIRSSEREKHIGHMGDVGVMMASFEIDPENRADFLRHDDLLEIMTKLVNAMNWHPQWVGEIDARKQMAEKWIAQGVVPRWFTIWYLFAEVKQKERAVLVGCYGMYLDEQGQTIPELNTFVSAFKYGDIEYGEQSDPYADTLPFLFALSLTHCKNVTILPDAVPTAVRQKRAKRGFPHVDFHVLDIKPMQRQVRQRDAGEKNGESRRALHLVRAHFKTFSADKPLFGKHTGTYWWHLSARGREENGRVDKQYTISPK